MQLNTNDLRQTLSDWIQQPSKTYPISLLNPKDVLVELFTYSEFQDLKIQLQNSQGPMKTPYNYAKVVMVPDEAIIDNYNLDTNTLHKHKVGDIISFDDSLVEGTPITEKGFTSDGRPKGGYLPLGKILHYMFIPDKLNPSYEFLFLIPQGIIKYKHDTDTLIVEQLDQNRTEN